jgi:hypothetical protein
VTALDLLLQAPTAVGVPFGARAGDRRARASGGCGLGAVGGARPDRMAGRRVGVMQRVVRGVAWVMQRTMRTSGAETLCTAANIFIGMRESPLVVKPYVERMTIAGLGAISPSRRHDLARLGLKAMLAGLLASLTTAAVAGMLA